MVVRNRRNLKLNVLNSNFPPPRTRRNKTKSSESANKQQDATPLDPTPEPMFDVNGAVQQVKEIYDTCKYLIVKAEKLIGNIERATHDTFHKAATNAQQDTQPNIVTEPRRRLKAPTRVAKIDILHRQFAKYLMESKEDGHIEWNTELFDFFHEDFSTNMTDLDKQLFTACIGRGSNATPDLSILMFKPSFFGNMSLEAITDDVSRKARDDAEKEREKGGKEEEEVEEEEEEGEEREEEEEEHFLSSVTRELNQVLIPSLEIINQSLTPYTSVDGRIPGLAKSTSPPSEMRITLSAMTEKEYPRLNVRRLDIDQSNCTAHLVTLVLSDLSPQFILKTSEWNKWLGNTLTRCRLIMTCMWNKASESSSRLLINEMILYLLASCALTGPEDSQDRNAGFAITEFILGMAASGNSAGSPITVINNNFTTKISGSIDYLTIRITKLQTAKGLKRILSEQKISSSTAWYRRILDHLRELQEYGRDNQYLIMEAKSVVGELRNHIPQVVAQSLCFAQELSKDTREEVICPFILTSGIDWILGALKRDPSGEAVFWVSECLSSKYTYGSMLLIGELLKQWVTQKAEVIWSYKDGRNGGVVRDANQL